MSSAEQPPIPSGAAVPEIDFGPGPLAALAGSNVSLARIGRLSLLAHHPTCARHDHHLLRPFGVALCLGCACLGTGLVAGIAGLIWWWPGTSWTTAVVLAALALAGYGLCLLQPFVRRRWFKIPARLALGLGLALVGGAAWLAPWTVAGVVVKLALIGGTVGLYIFASQLRAKHFDNPCAGCPWGGFPFCTHNLPTLRQLAAEGGHDPAFAAFLADLIGDLEPLSKTPPSLHGRPEHVPAEPKVGFGHLPLSSDEQA